MPSHPCGMKLDADDLRIIGALYFRGVQSAEDLRVALGMSRVTFFLRMKRLRRMRIVESGPSALLTDMRCFNLALVCRQRLFGLEMDVRSAGLFEGNLAADGTVADLVRFGESSRGLFGAN